jgi:SAM-dependent methyltransferase
MYGPEETDLVVKYYDQSFAISGEYEPAWYVERARRYGGPVVDLACGTGRLAILLARAGLDVTAVDRSTGMLDVFRRKLAEEAAPVRQRIAIAAQDITDLHLDRTFSTAICCDSAFHLASVRAEMAFLSSVRRHLAPQGWLLFNLPNPTCTFILESEGPEGSGYRERGRYPLPGTSDTLLVEQASIGDALEQRVETRLRLTRYDADGHVVERGESSWTSRYMFRYEAVHLLYRCGFEVASLAGDYRGGPVRAGSQLIFEARRSRLPIDRADPGEGDT